MKNAKIKAIVGLLIILVLPGCAFQKDSVQEEETVIEVVEEIQDATDALEEDTQEDTQEEVQEEIRENANKVIPERAEAYIPPQTIPGEYASDELMEGEELSEEELQQLQDFFSDIENYGFTVSPYETPEDIVWYYVFNWEGAGIPNCDYSKELLDEYFSIHNPENDYSIFYIPEYDTYEGLKALSGKDVKAFVERKTGITDFDLSLMSSSYTYFDSEDVFFAFVDPFVYENDITCLEGVKKDNIVQVVISFNDNHSCDSRITLEKTGDVDNPYHFISNRQLWEKKADEIIVIKDSETDETFACSVNYKSNGAILKPVINNATWGDAVALIDDKDLSDFSYIVEAVFCDVDGDGIKDTIAILAFGEDVVPVLCMGSYEYLGVPYYFDKSKSSVTEWLIENVSDINADNVIAYILWHQDEFKKIG